MKVIRIAATTAAVLAAFAIVGCTAQAAEPDTSSSPRASTSEKVTPTNTSASTPAPTSSEVVIPQNLQLECGAEQAFDQLNTAFKSRFGQEIGITDGYRSYDDQVGCRLAKGSLCADPGTSNHGWGKAVDIGGCCGVNTGTGPALDWLITNAGHYGWTHPLWAQPGGSKLEPWHWEYGNVS